MTLARIYTSGEVRRWHSNPRMARLTQTIADHQGRCVQLALMLHPQPTVGLLRLLALHDVPEVVTGDIPSPAKRAFPGLADALRQADFDVAYTMGISDAFDVTDEDIQWAKMIDALEAIAFAAMHGVTGSADWDDMIADMRARADRLGVLAEVDGFMMDIVEEDW